MKYNLGVKGIIRKNGKILILKRVEQDGHKPGIWETPGGTMDMENHPEEELKREINEETNLEVKIIEPFNVFTFIREDTGEFKVGITFICDYIKGEIKLSEEHDEYQWIDSKDFKNYKSIDSLYKEISDYCDKYGKK
jgi:8-oxo-dGTP diphosphatase